MRPADDRVRLKKEGGRYHHGNLKDALVLAAERSIAKSGSTDLPLRDVAKLAGVSHAAAYRHFVSKTALLAEVAVRGFASLKEKLLAAVEVAKAPDARLIELGVAYVTFALESSGSFRVMFDSALKPFTQFPGLAEAAAESLAVFQRVVKEAADAGALRSDDLNGSVTSAWALIHGHAVLLLDDHLALGVEDAATSARGTMRRLVDGLRAR
ncbi:MAG: TetR/AcrR family transcriptional regulator [Archangiaceae bacterium]|nr:TetR/AcrR family transcriptional regulator [Archangiaceae bacterium]